MREREHEVTFFNQIEWQKIYSFNIDKKILKDQTPFEIPDNYVFEASVYRCINDYTNYSKSIQIKIFDKNIEEYKAHHEFIVWRHPYCFLPSLIYIKQNEKDYIVTFSDELCIEIICLNDGYVKICSYKDSISNIYFWPLEMFIELDEYSNSFKIKILGYDYISKLYRYFILKDVDIENLSIQQNIELMELYGDENNQFNYASID